MVEWSGNSRCRAEVAAGRLRWYRSGEYSRQSVSKSASNFEHFEFRSLWSVSSQETGARFSSAPTGSQHDFAAAMASYSYDETGQYLVRAAA